jgi:hypothetical protein
VTLSESEMKRLIGRLNSKDSQSGFGWKDIKEEICSIELTEEVDSN